MRLPKFFIRTRDDGATHTEAAHIPGGRSLRDLVFGANDGLVAAFAVVSGVHGAAVSTRIVLLAGLAELIGGTIAMGLGAFLAAKSEREFISSEREREEREVREFPEEERKEVRTIYARKGFRGQALDQMVAHVTADPTFWVDTMMTEELGLSAVPTAAPLRSGFVVAVAYALGAAFPVIPYALPVPVHAAFVASVVATLAALFVAGALKTRMTGRPWLRSGLETVLVGALAAAATFLAGHFIAKGAS
ncbi:MAG TPA: VIT1/CCC1 transporter family protein [Myxococcales bacterium]|nr:VIT1/CCC1 transporter family protein [Myxococcales bacterium]